MSVFTVNVPADYQGNEYTINNATIIPGIINRSLT